MAIGKELFEPMLSDFRDPEDVIKQDFPTVSPCSRRRALRRGCALLLALICVFAIPAQSPAAQSPQSLSSAGQKPAFSTSAAQTPKAPAADAPSTPPAAAPDPLGEARILVRKGDFDAAIQKYQQFLAEKPKSPDAYAGLVRAYLKKKDVNRAYEVLTTGLQVTDAWPLHVALGEVYFRQGKIADAEKEWVGVINSGYPSARAYLGLARVRWSVCMYKSSKAMVDKAHALDPSDPDIQKAWALGLPPSERIKYFETYLAGPGDATPEERGDVQRYLSYLKERATQSPHSCRLVSKTTAAEVPLLRLLADPQHLRGYGLAVTLNGTRTKLLLDTGAKGILIDRPIAERAGITRLRQTRIWGVGDNGGRKGYIGTADSIRIGGLEFRDCPVEVMENRSVAEGDGLIGADVFEDFLVEINFPHEKLNLSELPKPPGESDQPLGLESEEDAEPRDRYFAPEMQSFTHVYRFGHNLLIPTKIGDAPYKLFLLDTGALTSSITPEAAREITKIHGDSDATVRGLSGSVSRVYTANNTVLQFGQVRQENQDMLSFDTRSFSEGLGTEISGFLGFTTLRFLDIKIDYRDGLVDFHYDKERFSHF